MQKRRRKNWSKKRHKVKVCCAKNRQPTQLETSICDFFYLCQPDIVKIKSEFSSQNNFFCNDRLHGLCDTWASNTARSLSERQIVFLFNLVGCLREYLHRWIDVKWRVIVSRQKSNKFFHMFSIEYQACFEIWFDENIDWLWI